MALSRLNHWQRACAVMGIVVFLVALMGGVLAAAVGGGGSLAVAASSSSGERTASGSAQLPAAVKAQAESSLVRPSDLPAGWVAGGAVATSRTSPWSKQLAGCVGVPSRIARIEPTKFNSPSYGSADHTAAVEDSVSVYPSAADARAAFQAMANGKTPSCMNQIGGQALRASVQNQAGSGATVGNVSIAALAPGSYLRGQTGYTVTIPLASGGRQLTIISTAIQFVHGRFVHQLTFNGNGVAFPALLQVHLTQLAEARN
ncbi:MAG TPA: hypothetical protein VNU75_06785 [Acidimicrobiales bacterium]|nr:hypothetical protein [Acidimicrobiales bacterium]